MQSQHFAKHRLAQAVSIALGVSLTSPIAAQDPIVDEPMIEEVVVTGIRSSLKRAMDTKRDSQGVVDAITAEDIGDFPDTNLAEALQRITGVAIDRQRGEGATVTVRGFGADFNLVTLNGRQMPTHSGLGRSFDFGDIASESVSGVEVYKTSRANIPSGGIGATINVLTAKPLDRPGLQLSAGGKAVHDKSTYAGDDATPDSRLSRRRHSLTTPSASRYRVPFKSGTRAWLKDSIRLGSSEKAAASLITASKPIFPQRARLSRCHNKWFTSWTSGSGLVLTGS